MKKLPQKMALAAGGAALLAIAGVGATLLLVQPDDYRARIIAGVKQGTGADLGLPQAIHWQLWPLGFQTDAVTFGNGGQESLLEAGHVSATLKISSLFSGQPAFSALAFNDARVQLARDGENWNWSAVLKKLATSSASTDTALSFSNSSLSWKNPADQKPQEIAFSRFELQAGQGGMHPLQAEFTYSHQDESGNNLLLQNTLKGNLQRTAPDSLKFTSLQWGSAVSSTLFPGNLDLGLQGDAELTSGRLRIPGAILQGSYKSLGMESAYAMTVKAVAELDLAQSQLSLQKLDTVTAARGDRIAAERLLANWQTGHLDAHQLKVTHQHGTQPVTLTTELKADLPQGRIELAAFELALSKSKGQGKLSATLPFLGKGLLSSAGNIWEGLKVDGQFSADPVDMAELLALAGQAPAAGSRGTGRLDARLEGEGDQFFLRDIRFKTADGSITGEAGVTALASTPRHVARLRADHLDLDALLPKSGKLSAPGIDQFKNRNFDINLQAGSLQAFSQSWSDVQLEARASPGRLEIATLRGKSGKGSFSLPLTLSVTDKGSAISARPDIKDMDIAALAALLADKQLTGRFTSKGDVQLTGSTLQDWQKSANGNLSFRLENGSSKGNLMKGIMEKMQGYKSLLPELAPDAGTLGTGDKTDIVLLDTDNSFSKGIITTRLKALDLGRARLHGDGHFDANQQTLDYGITLSLDKSVFAAKDKGMDMPMQCKGNLVEEQTDFFSALGDDCKMSEDAMHDIMSRALTRRFRDS
jgi:uncharacterized protein involved in outer membrane biogenesis